jgi:hypothetical protein
MEFIKKYVASLVGGAESLAGPQFEGSIVLEKGPGERGPIIGCFLVEPFNTDKKVVVAVLPSSVFVVEVTASPSGTPTVFKYKPSSSSDAFTSCLVFPLSISSGPDLETRECGLILGTQEGVIELVEVRLPLSGGVKVVAQCSKKLNTSIACMSRVSSSTSLVGMGTTDGRLLIWDPVVNPHIPLVSVKVGDGKCVSTMAAVNDGGSTKIYVSDSSSTIYIYEVNTEGMVTVENSTTRFDFPSEAGDVSVTALAFSETLGKLLVLVATSDVFIIDISTQCIVQRYPATLMTCGSPLTSLTTHDLDSSTLVVLGGMDGSVSIRELSYRTNEPSKLQCVLLATYLPRDDEPERPHNLFPCPITSVSISQSEYTIAGDAQCIIHIHRIPKRDTQKPPIVADFEEEDEYIRRLQLSAGPVVVAGETDEQQVLEVDVGHQLDNIVPKDGMEDVVSAGSVVVEVEEAAEEVNEIAPKDEDNVLDEVSAVHVEGGPVTDEEVEPATVDEEKADEVAGDGEIDSTDRIPSPEEVEQDIVSPANGDKTGPAGDVSPTDNILDFISLDDEDLDRMAELELEDLSPKNDPTPNDH